MSRKFAIERLTSIIPDLEESGLGLLEAARWLDYLSIKRAAAQLVKDGAEAAEVEEDYELRTPAQELEEHRDAAFDDSGDTLCQWFDDIGEMGEEFDPGFKLPVASQDVV